ncbi:unnamed protein product [Ranitomeya imitator]|uniref:Cadherin domain-containing protein n=1 Tax=Ranitomeya imitator TaxID=111125 RepID=A0ABN9M764_9NEOB|nr:unnamed protein product [Ranitomeya imitator]
MDYRRSPKAWARQVVCSLLLYSWGWVSGQLRYSVAEESHPGTVVGNVARDLGINRVNLDNRRLHLGTEGSSRYFIIDQNRFLLVGQRIDREELCGSTVNCLLHAEIMVQDPLELFNLEITILDINDNSPVFPVDKQEIRIIEQLLAPNDGLILPELVLQKILDREEKKEHRLLLTALDGGEKPRTGTLQITTGEIFVKGNVDYEEARFYELSIKAVDKGVPEMEGRCAVQVEIVDVNDNSPEIIFTANYNPVPENVLEGTVIGLITVRDKDSGKNGGISLEVSPDLPFKCQPMSQRYALIWGLSSLSSQITISLNISDVNDNPPAFLHNVYNAFIPENNEAGRLLCSVSAVDPDEGDNANLIYSITESHIHGSPVSSFVYINSDTGNIYAQRSFDYEQFQVLQITARVEDSGSPKLSSNVSVFIFILDTNDNPPTILYPENTAETIAQETIPRSAAAGYLVSKVSAVDVDSGHNAWLLYSLVQSAGPALFHISEYTGEVRTLRGLHEMDNTEQRLVIAVSDHGEPSMTTTATIIVNILDSVAQESPKSQDFLTNAKSAPDLTLYLIVSLVAISAVFLVTFSILLVRCLRKNYDSGCGFCFSDKSLSTSYMDQYKPTLYLNTDGTLKYMEVRMAPPDPPSQCYPGCFPPAPVADFAFTTPSDCSQLTDICRETTAITDSDNVSEHQFVSHS